MKNIPGHQSVNLSDVFLVARGVQSEWMTMGAAEEKFEREARKRLGGSIAFVSKQKVNWSEYDDQKKDK